MFAHKPFILFLIMAICVVEKKIGLLAIDEILNVLKNGDWHGFKEITDKTGVQEFKVELVADLLADYGFLEYDRKEKRVKVSPQLLVFLKKIDGLERDEHAGAKERLLSGASV